MADESAKQSTEWSEEEDRYHEAGVDRRRRAADVGLEAPLRTVPHGDGPDPVPATTLVTEVLEVLATARQSAVVAVDADGRFAGIFTERDLGHALAMGTWDPSTTTVADLMTANPVTLAPGDPMGHALAQIAVGGSFRHIPLVERDGRPAGIVTSEDLLRFVADLLGPQVANYPPVPPPPAAETAGG